jgi:hypothetical protein
VIELKKFVTEYTEATGGYGDFLGIHPSFFSEGSVSLLRVLWVQVWLR